MPDSLGFLCLSKADPAPSCGRILQRNAAPGLTWNSQPAGPVDKIPGHTSAPGTGSAAEPSTSKEYACEVFERSPGGAA